MAEELQEIFRFIPGLLCNARVCTMRLVTCKKPYQVPIIKKSGDYI